MPGNVVTCRPSICRTRSSELPVAAGQAVDVDERTAIYRPAARKEIIVLTRKQAFGGRARVAWLRHEMSNAVALGKIDETRPVPRPHRRAVESLGGDREKRRIVETIDPDIPTPIFIDDNGELPAVRRQARCPERPRLDRDWRGDTRTIGPHQGSVRGRRFRLKHQGASGRERETSAPSRAKGNVETPSSSFTGAPVTVTVSRSTSNGMPNKERRRRRRCGRSANIQHGIREPRRFAVPRWPASARRCETALHHRER